MAEPLSYQLLQAARTCLQQISVVNGFHTDAGASVVIEPSQVPKDDDSILAVVYAGGKQPGVAAVRRTHREIHFRIIAKTFGAPNEAQLKLHQILADVTRAMRDQQTRFPTGLTFPEYVEEQPIPTQQGMTWVGAYVQYASTVNSKP